MLRIFLVTIEKCLSLVQNDPPYESIAKDGIQGREWLIKRSSCRNRDVIIVCDYLNKYINMSLLTLNSETII